MGRTFLPIALVAAALAGCAGRDPEPIATVQDYDKTSTCDMIQAEIQANNVKVNRLAYERGLKVVQNLSAAVVGIVVWPVFFAMDAKGAALAEVGALQARQEYLGALAQQRCARR